MKPTLRDAAHPHGVLMCSMCECAIEDGQDHVLIAGGDLAAHSGLCEVALAYCCAAHDPVLGLDFAHRVREEWLATLHGER